MQYKLTSLWNESGVFLLQVLRTACDNVHHRFCGYGLFRLNVLRLCSKGKFKSIGRLKQPLRQCPGFKPGSEAIVERQLGDI